LPQHPARDGVSCGCPDSNVPHDAQAKRREILSAHQPSTQLRDRHADTRVGGSLRRGFACRQQIARASGSGAGSLSAQCSNEFVRLSFSSRAVRVVLRAGVRAVRRAANHADRERRQRPHHRAQFLEWPIRFRGHGKPLADTHPCLTGVVSRSRSCPRHFAQRRLSHRIMVPLSLRQTSVAVLPTLRRP